MSPRPSSPRTVPELLRAWLVLSAGASGQGPVTIATSDPGADIPIEVRRGVLLVRRDRVVAVLRERALAEFCADGPRLLRMLVEALAVEWDAHEPVRGRCPVCRPDAPCRARDRIANMLVRTAR